MNVRSWAIALALGLSLLAGLFAPLAPASAGVPAISPLDITVQRQCQDNHTARFGVTITNLSRRTLHVFELEVFIEHSATPRALGIHFTFIPIELEPGETFKYRFPVRPVDFGLRSFSRGYFRGDATVLVLEPIPPVSESYALRDCTRSP